MHHRAFVVATIVGITAACSPSAEEESPPAATADSQPAATEAAPALPRTAAPDGARAFIASPADGAVVSSPFTVTFGAENIEVMPAGEAAKGAGHHHLLINAPLPDFGMPIPKSDQYRHFGGGQTETELTLEPGTYELRLLFGDHLHIPHEPPIYSDVVTITVE
jgi:hypothetical protein